ncbi:hypothetical protein I551_3160 [Mycobacterium ulcerans str. Harvey]|uniref:Uncharacterized protein n=1 Tax=Mycobacterium ulcerans str. Harvey TaxID=1299332 RepID=A0ABP3AKY6_MYCUL|nr:hypothetical protein I551_3160 [Mycobacterium ulcerans str. Harvey]
MTNRFFTRIIFEYTSEKILGDDNHRPAFRDHTVLTADNFRRQVTTPIELEPGR